MQRGRLWPRSVGVGPACAGLFADGLIVFPPDSGRVQQAGRAPGTNGQRGGPISTETRVNERIRVPEVRLIGPGEQVGIVRIEDTSRRRGRRSRPCRGAQCQTAGLQDRTTAKYKYEPRRRRRESAETNSRPSVQEQKLRPKIDDHGYETKRAVVATWRRDRRSRSPLCSVDVSSRGQVGLSIAAAAGCGRRRSGVIETSARTGRNAAMVLAPHRSAKTALGPPQVNRLAGRR